MFITCVCNYRLKGFSSYLVSSLSCQRSLLTPKLQLVRRTPSDTPLHRREILSIGGSEELYCAFLTQTLARMPKHICMRLCQYVQYQSQALVQALMLDKDLQPRHFIHYGGKLGFLKVSSVQP